ncbi:hypothetical protein D0Y65_045085, partial [Glycine soja]
VYGNWGRRTHCIWDMLSGRLKVKLRARFRVNDFRVNLDIGFNIADNEILTDTIANIFPLWIQIPKICSKVANPFNTYKWIESLHFKKLQFFVG